MANGSKGRCFWLVGLVGAVIALSALGGEAVAQVDDADCFSGACEGKKGIPKCPTGYGEVGLVLYANSKADAGGDCETVVSCTNLGHKSVEMNCRFYYGFYPIPPSGDVRDALCYAVTPNVAPGDTNECATDATMAPHFQSGGIFLAADGNCPPFEGKGLVCVKGGDADDIVCQAHLICRTLSVLEKIDVVRKKESHGDSDRDREHKSRH
jgi:hypothetical protein